MITSDGNFFIIALNNRYDFKMALNPMKNKNTVLNISPDTFNAFAKKLSFQYPANTQTIITKILIKYEYITNYIWCFKQKADIGETWGLLSACL